MMEPMALGSPPSSPSTSPTAPNPNFLPAFLIGDNQAPSPRTTSISPTSKNRTLGFKPSSPVGESRDRSRYLSQSPDATQSFNISALTDKSGPPARSLFDTLDGKRIEFVSPIKDTQRHNLTKNLNDSLTINKSYRRQTLDNPDSMWVTVLGFPPHAASLILSHFAQCGNIVERKFPPEGNWVHLKYSSKYEAAKALSFNGKLISNTIMIGVIACNLSENKENTSVNSVITSPNRARPLNQSYNMQHNSTEVLQPGNVPQKSTGLVSKAMEYVFGW